MVDLCYHYTCEKQGSQSQKQTSYTVMKERPRRNQPNKVRGRILADVAHMDITDFFGIVSGNKINDKFECTGYHAVKSDKFHALMFDQFQNGYYATGEKVGRAWLSSLPD